MHTAGVKWRWAGFRTAHLFSPTTLGVGVHFTQPMQPHSKPSKVAALVPAWQSSAFIQATLDSLSAQTYPHLEVIVSVDECNDSTYEICIAHAQKDARFRVIRQSQRLGYVGNCNFLLNQAEADYVLFAFHDDILNPDYITLLAEVLDARPEVVMSYSDVHLTNTNGTEEHWVFTELEGVRDPVQRGVLMMSGKNKWWVPNRGLFRLGQARQINGLKTHHAGEFSADWPWMFHMSLLGEFARVPKTLCYKYYKPGSLSRSWQFSKHQIYEVYAAIMREIWISGLTTEQKLTLASPLARWLYHNNPDRLGEGK